MAAKRKAELDADPKKRADADAVIKKKEDLDAAKKRKEDLDADAKRKADIEAKRKAEEAEAARKKKDAEDEAARKKKDAEDEAARQKKKHDEDEARRKRDEDSLKKKKDIETAKRRRRAVLRNLVGILVLRAVISTTDSVIQNVSTIPIPQQQETGSMAAPSPTTQPQAPSSTPAIGSIVAGTALGLGAVAATAWALGAFNPIPEGNTDEWPETLTVYSDREGVNYITEYEYNNKGKNERMKYDISGCLTCQAEENQECPAKPIYKGLLTFQGGVTKCISYNTNLSANKRFEVLSDTTGCKKCEDDDEDDDDDDDDDDEDEDDEDEDKDKDKDDGDDDDKLLPPPLAPPLAAAAAAAAAEEEKEEELPEILQPEEKRESFSKGGLQEGGARRQTRRHRPPPSIHITKLLDLLTKIKGKMISHLPRYHMDDVLKRHD